MVKMLTSGYYVDFIVTSASDFGVLAKLAILYTIVYFKILSINTLRLVFDPY